jgi:transcriptional regulator with XRE-family HTH domain
VVILPVARGDICSDRRRRAPRTIREVAAQASSTFGPQLTAWRASTGLDVDDVAERLRVPAATILGWESGRARPGLHALLTLAEVLDFDLQDALVLLRADRSRQPDRDEVVLLDLAELQTLLDVADGRTPARDATEVLASIDARASAHRD